MENLSADSKDTNGGKTGSPDGTSDDSGRVSADTDDTDDDDDDDDDEMDFAAELRKRAFREKSDDDGNS